MKEGGKKKEGLASLKSAAMTHVRDLVSQMGMEF
jgi:hypothetical protein